MLLQTKFEKAWCGRSATTLVAVGHEYKSTKVQSKHLNPGLKTLPGRREGS
ncbi:hypothetical protein [Shewanella livingstonensis]|uniref:hypothetical protein n=1 Tax=Shewanella livingstonensis TaxID=150120 RepID=UPI0013E32857|nr:hypothetical protein [Shewanella livingstonensis]